MKKLITLILAITTSVVIGQTTNLSPQMINTAGGSGLVAGIYYDYTVGEPITLFGGTGCDSIFSGFQHCAIDTLRYKLLTATASGSTTFCQTRGHVTLTAPTGLHYLWSNGATTQTISPTVSGTYHVRVTNTCGDTLSTTAIVVNVLTPPTPSICMVSTDSVTNFNYNVIYWDNTQYPSADSFVVLRNCSGPYDTLGKVPRDSSRYVDIDSMVCGPHGGNPNNSPFTYALAVQDTCGNISALSPPHKTTNCAVGSNSLIWNDYLINGAIVATGYDVYWSSNGSVSNYTRIQQGASSPFTALPSSITYPNQSFRIDPVFSFSCSINERLASGSHNGTDAAVRRKSHSNTANRQAASGISQYSNNNAQILVYPNPATNTVNVSCTSITNKTILSMYDATGRMVLQQSCVNGNQVQTIDIQTLENGMYFIEVCGARKIVTVNK